MRYDKMVISAVVLSILNTGCVKPTEEIAGAETVVYEEQSNPVVYEDGSQPVYSDPSTGQQTRTTSNVYENKAVTQTDPYQQPVSMNTPASTGDPYQSGGGASSSGGGAYDDPYSSSGGGDGYNPVDDPYASSSTSSTYSTNVPYGSSSSYGGDSGSQKGLQLQVAALKDYYAAEEFRKGLSLDPKYGSYVKKGAINKVIVTGLSTRAEAKALADRQFPGAFIVGGYETGSSSSSSPAYTPPSSGSAGDINSGIGVQVGAFTSKGNARLLAQKKAGGEYTAVVKTAQVGGRTIYKAIILGFATRADAKRAIDSGRFGSAFIVTGINP